MQSYVVTRIDRPGEAYHLLVFGPAATPIAVAATDGDGARVLSHAELSGVARHLSVDAERARTVAGVGPDAGAELVWRPCRASRSPLYPLWRVRKNGSAVYVDQQGQTWSHLEDDPGRGG